MPSRNELRHLKAAAKILWPRFGPWSFRTWERLNRAYFGDELRPCGILFGLTAHGHALAYYSPADTTITLHSSLLRPMTENPWSLGPKLGKRFAGDALLHEMLHQLL